MAVLHKKYTALIRAAAGLALLSLLAAQPSSAVPLEVYGRLPYIENVALSPDGSRIALVRTNADARALFLISLSDGKLTGKPLALGGTKLRSITWADNDHLMIFTSVATIPRNLLDDVEEWFQLSVWDVVKQTLNTYPDTEKSEEVKIMNAINGRVMVRYPGGHTVLFIPGIYATDVTLPALFRVDLTTGKQTMVRQGTGHETNKWLVDEAGEVAAEENYDEKKQRWSMSERRDGHLREVTSGHEAIDIPELLGFGPDPGTLLVEKHEDGDPVWRLLSLKDGSFGPPLAERSALEEPIEDRLTHRMIGGVHVDDTTHYVFFDPGVESAWKSILDGFSGEQVELISASADFKQVVVKVTGPLHGFAYLLMDMATHRAKLVGNVYEGLSQPLEIKRVTYEAADGFKVPAYLTLPRGKPLKSLPLIVFPHGGPEARDTADFDWWGQAMADQGYLVLQANYRGSSLTSAHLAAGFGEWGRKMQTDLSDGVRYLVKQGMVDPARVCIVGASYGGYAALAGVTLDPGVYRCAVSVAGISDLKRMLQDVNPNAKWERRYWNRYMGVTGPSDPLLQQISPIKHIEAISVPVLLIHGRDDTVVTYDQSTVMFDAMKSAKKQVEMVTLKKEDHWLSRSETRLQMLQSVVAFLRTYNPPD
jgi:dipeptidyl aminopeptidase/acylaminoacyl peptidase